MIQQILSKYYPHADQNQAYDEDMEKLVAAI